MALSSDLISQLVKATTSSDEKQNTGSTAYGTTVVSGGKTYVKLDGSNQLTPVSTMADVKDGERVSVLLKDHTATITGNLSSPSARTDDVKDVGAKIDSFDIILADKVNVDRLQAETARIDNLVAAMGDIDDLISESVTVTDLLTALNAEIENLDVIKLDAEVADITYATIDTLEATNAQIYNLEATYGDFNVLTTDKLNAVDAYIANLEVDKLSAVEAELKYANIEFANISEAAIRNFYAKSGMIDDLIISDATVTDALIAVKFKGDLIEVGTLKADRLLLKGEDGLFYELNMSVDGDLGVSDKYTDDELQNGLLGDVIVAKSIAAEKVAVEDLVAFEATIAGFHITGDELDEEDNLLTPGAIYSGVKESVDNSTRGIYLDNLGQMAIGDGDSYVRYRKTETGEWKLEIALGSSGKTLEEDIQDAKEAASTIKVGARNLLRNSKTLVFEKYYFYGEQAGDGEDTPAVLGVGVLGNMLLGLDNTGETSVAVANEIITEPETNTTVVETGTSEDYKHQGFADGMTLHDYHLIKMENAIVKALAGVATARITTISLPAANWSGSGTIYSQSVIVDGVTANSKVDLLPSPEQLNELLLAEISLTAANSNGSITVFAIGDAPSSDLEVQAMITEVIIPEVST